MELGEVMMMKIEFVEPFSRAWGRMKTALFKPFNLNKWFALGFCAFLADLIEGHGGSNNPEARFGDGDFSDFIHAPSRAWNWMMDNPGWLAFIVVAVFFLIALIVLLTWLSSRGVFMFMDNVVHDRYQIVAPWKEYGRQANSLFLWRLGYGIICFFLIVLFLAIFFSMGAEMYDQSYSRRIPINFLITMGFFFLVMVMTLSFISLLLKDFVAPVMYKHKLSSTQAWGRFLNIFKQYPLHFIGYGFLILFMTIIVVICVILGGLFTCCIGFLLLIIPYIGSVVMLPISYTFRGFSLEFLSQFGPDFDVFPSEEETA